MAMVTNAAGTLGAKFRNNSIAFRLSKPVSTGASKTSGKCWKIFQILVKKLPEAPGMPSRCGTWPIQ
jgi:hypothetical protein